MVVIPSRYQHLSTAIIMLYSIVKAGISTVHLAKACYVTILIQYDKRIRGYEGDHHHRRYLFNISQKKYQTSVFT